MRTTKFPLPGFSSLITTLAKPFRQVSSLAARVLKAFQLLHASMVTSGRRDDVEVLASAVVLALAVDFFAGAFFLGDEIFAIFAC